MEYFLNAGHWSSLFAVPDAVVDKYIKLASGSAVKVLLYILRNSGRPVDTSEISVRLGINADDVKDAFNFWNEVGILGTCPVSSENSITQKTSEPIRRNEPAKETVKAEYQPAPEAPKNTNAENTEQAAAAEIVKNTQPSSGNYSITPREIEKMKEESKEIRDMIDMAQQTTGSMITPGMLKSLIWQHEYLGLRIDVILMLLSYCTSIGKAGVSYIETIASSWSQNDVNTLEKAQNEIERMTNSNNYFSRAAIAFGLKRHPTPNQKKFFEEWYRKGYSIELVECACERAADFGKAMTANYINGILENWNKKDIKTRKQAEEEHKTGKSKSYARQEQSYDMSEFKKFSVTFSGNTKKQNENDQ